MKTFRVYQHPVFGYTAVKHGFAWPVLCFGIAWGLSKKLWAVTVGVCLGYGIVAVMIILARVSASTFDLCVAIFAYGYLWLSLAVHGNACRAQHLTQRGYVHLDTIAALSPAQAIAQAVQQPHGRLA